MKSERKVIWKPVIKWSPPDWALISLFSIPKTNFLSARTFQHGGRFPSEKGPIVVSADINHVPRTRSVRKIAVKTMQIRASNAKTGVRPVVSPIRTLARVQFPGLPPRVFHRREERDGRRAENRILPRLDRCYSAYYGFEIDTSSLSLWGSLFQMLVRSPNIDDCTPVPLIIQCCVIYPSQTWNWISQVCIWFSPRLFTLFPIDNGVLDFALVPRLRFPKPIKQTFQTGKH